MADVRHVAQAGWRRISVEQMAAAERVLQHWFARVSAAAPVLTANDAVANSRRDDRSSAAT